MKWYTLLLACAFVAQGSSLGVGSGQSMIDLEVPTEQPSTDLVVRSNVAIDSWSGSTTALQERRLILGLVTASLQTLTAFSGAACAAAYAAPNALTGTACAATTFVTLAYLVYAHWQGVEATKKLRRNYPTLDGLQGPPSQTIDFMFELHANSTTTAAMAHAFARTPGNELLVARHRCQSAGCYDYFYSNYEHPSIGRTVHKLVQRPRDEWTKAILSKRQTVETAYEDTYKEKDGTPIYGTYEYWDSNTADENYVANNESEDDFAESLYDAAAQQAAFQNQGYYCVNIVDRDRGGNVDTTGYFDVSEGVNMDDPTNEQNYLRQCYNKEFGKKRDGQLRATKFVA